MPLDPALPVPVLAGYTESADETRIGHRLSLSATIAAQMAWPMSDIQGELARWGLDAGQVRERVYRAATPRERERWHALWLLAQGWSAGSVAALARDAHTIGGGSPTSANTATALAFEQTGGPPPPSPRTPRRT